MSTEAVLIQQHLIDPEICIRCNTCEATCPVGAITHDSRNYVVDASLVKPGKNLFVAAIVNTNGAGGFCSHASNMVLRHAVNPGTNQLRIAGTWKARRGPAMKDLSTPFPTPNLGHYKSIVSLYNGMIAPLVPYAIRGALWYQGESNNGEGMLHAEKMKALIHGWRKLWSDETMPFYFVQIAPFTYRNTGLPFLWEAQLAASKIPGVGMAATMDISNIKDIHPKNKQEVGRRLALIALARTYGREGLVISGPFYKSMKAEGGKVRISFEGAAGGLKATDGKDLTHFTVAGADKKFVPAKAVIEGNEVVVSAESEGADRGDKGLANGHDGLLFVLPDRHRSAMRRHYAGRGRP